MLEEACVCDGAFDCDFKGAPKEFSKHWTDKATEAFKATSSKTMIAHDVLLTYPDPNKVFVIEADASDCSLLPRCLPCLFLESQALACSDPVRYT
jgi:hypothetical protein